MSSKKAAERGTKRTCPSCEERFYDLNRDPVTCPMCQAAFELAAFGNRPDAETRAQESAEKANRKATSKKPVFVPEPEIAAVDAELPPDVPDVALEGEGAVAAEGEEETFLPEEEEDTDVTGFIDGGIEEAGEEET